MVIIMHKTENERFTNNNCSQNFLMHDPPLEANNLIYDEGPFNQRFPFFLKLKRSD